MRRLPETPRGAAIRLELEGESIPAFEGEPVAAALLAAGEPVLSRSIKYHRPRGPFCFASACSHCLMRVDGVPNVYACQTQAREGMRLERQNAFPSAKVDIFASIDWLFPKGLNHHEMFAGVPVAEKVMAKVARHLAGLGKLPDTRGPESLPALTLHTPIAIAGGGAAGMGALETLSAHAGARFQLFEKRAFLGGRLGPREQRAGPVHLGASVMGLYEDEQGRFLAVAKRLPQGTQLWKVYAQRFLIAVGGHPQLLPFENNDLPGIFAGQALRQLVEEQGMVPDRVVLAGHGPELPSLAALLQSKGVKVRGILNLKGAATPGGMAVTSIKAHGFGRLRAVSFETAEGKKQRLSCDALALCLPSAASFELARQGGARVRFDTKQESFVVEATPEGRTHAPDVFVAGDVTGFGLANEAHASGQRAARTLLESLS